MDAMQPVREAVSYRGLFTAGWFGVREKHCSWLEIYNRLRVSEQADESVAPPSFQNQIFEGPDTDIETGNPSSLPLNACINFTCILEKFDILALCHRIAALQRKAFQA